MGSQVIRVLFIARYLQLVNHRKVMALAAQPGIELIQIAPRHWADELRSYRQELQTSENYRFLPLDTRGRQGDIHRFLYLPPGLELRHIKPDIIHLEEEPDSLVALQVVLARHLLARQAKVILFTWQNIDRPRSRAVDGLMQFVMHHTDRMIAGNQEAMQVLRRHNFNKPIDVLPQLGVDTSTFYPHNGRAVRVQLGLRGFVVGYAGRLVAEKGLDTLIAAASRIPDTSVLLVGAGPMQHELQTQALLHGITERVHFVPPVAHEQIPSFLNAMDVFVLPSRTTPTWKEQFGHVLIEAMACGIPVVGSDSGSISEVIDDAGLLFQQDCVNGLTERLLSIRDDPPLRARLQARGLERVQAHYTHQRIAEQTAKIYAECIGHS